jgi:molecular chaperone GrpE (heat shock protein)
MELIQLRDALAEGATADSPASPILEQFRQDVDDLLERQGAKPFVCPGDRFDPTQQSVKRSRPADNFADAGRVIQRLRPGFRYHEKVILRPEEVVALARPETDNSENPRGNHP